MMRSTLTIDPDVEQLLREAVAQTKKPYKVVVNEALRRGLSVAEPAPTRPFKVEALALGWNATLDPTGFNRLLDQLAVESFADMQKASVQAPSQSLAPEQ
jgi:hypothetical protein